MHPGNTSWSDPVNPGNTSWSDSVNPGNTYWSDPVNPGNTYWSDPRNPGRVKGQMKSRKGKGRVGEEDGAERWRQGLEGGAGIQPGSWLDGVLVTPASGRGGFRGSEYQRPGVRGANTQGADYWEEHWEDQATGLQGQAHTGDLYTVRLPASHLPRYHRRAAGARLNSALTSPLTSVSMEITGRNLQPPSPAPDGREDTSAALPVRGRLSAKPAQRAGFLPTLGTSRPIAPVSHAR
ncbi:unnamed protein product [Arctogadus glacialis]